MSPLKRARAEAGILTLAVGLVATWFVVRAPDRSAAQVAGQRGAHVAVQVPTPPTKTAPSHAPRSPAPTKRAPAPRAPASAAPPRATRGLAVQTPAPPVARPEAAAPSAAPARRPAPPAPAAAAGRGHARLRFAPTPALARQLSPRLCLRADGQVIAGDHSAPPLPAWAQRGYATDLMVPTTPPSPGCGHLLRADLMQRLVPELEVAPPGTVLKVWVAGEPGAEELALQLSEEG